MYTVTAPIISDGHFDKYHLLQELRRCKADRIALAVNRDLPYPFSSPATLARLKEMVEFFRREGFGIVIWIGETLGHDQVTQFPEGCETPYRRMKLPNKGTVASFCPTDQRFLEDLCRWVQDAARLSPDLILLDDDLRMNGGCVCNAHVAWMNREAGEELTAEEWYRRAFTGRENKYRDIWMKVQGESLYSVARALRRAVDEIDESIRMGICATHHLWDADGADPETVIRILAGKTTPFLRTFGAPYHSYSNRKDTVGTSVELERWENHVSSTWGIERISEGDTYPRPRFYCPASYLECFDQILRADGSNDGILKYAFDYASDAYYEQGYADAWAKNLPLYEEIEELFRGKTAVGVVPYLAPHLLRQADLGKTPPLKVLDHSAGNYNASADLAIKNNLPTAYEGAGVRIIFGENARHVPLEVLSQGCILDLPAANILAERGVDVGLSEENAEGTLSASYLGGALQYFPEENEYVRISGAVSPSPVRPKQGAKILTQFVSGETRLSGIFRYENRQRQRFLVFPFNAALLYGREAKASGYLNGYALRRLLVSQIEWLSGTPLPAYAEGNYPYLYTLVKKNDSALSMGLWNLFEDKIHDLTVKVNGDYETVRFINCTGVCEGNTVRLTSVLYPYEFAGIEFRK